MADSSSKLKNKVSPHIDRQLPGFVREDHPLFVTFLKHYYQFLESGELSLGGSNDFLIQETNTVNYILNENEDFVVMESSTGKFELGETIRGEQSGHTAKILVDDYDGTKRLFITSQNKFIVGENIVGQTSGAKAPVVSYRGNPIQNIQQLLSYADVDNTLFSFLDKFQQSILESLPQTIADDISKRNLVKNIKDLYEAKGTEEGHKLFFRILFDEESSLIYPRENVLRVSNGQWSDDFIMRVVEVGTSNFSELVGRRITGADSEASAVVQTVIKYKSGSTLVAELNLDRSTITGDFIINEVVSGVSNVLDQTITATVSGIVDQVEIVNGGSYYSVGDTVTFENLGTVGVRGQVATVGAGSIDYITCCAGGTGYTYDDVVIVDNSNTEGSGLSAKIAILGGSFELENATDPDNFHLETDDETHIVLEHADNILNEDGDYILFEDGFKQIREETAPYYMQQEEQVGKNDRLVLEDGGQIIIEEETFNDLGVPSEAGAITKINVLDPGNGYIKLPRISIQTSTGSGALNYAVSYSGVGRVLSVNITNLGLSYTAAPEVSFYKKVVVRGVTGSFQVGDTFTSHEAAVVSFDPIQSLLELDTPIMHFITGDVLISATGATATVVDCNHAMGRTNIVSVGNTGGVFVTDRGKVSETSMKIQDSFFYQDYSYVVRVGQSINNWRDSVKRSIHPGGWNVFGEVSFATSLADAQLNSLRIKNPTAGDVIDYVGDDRFTPELASMFETLFTTVFGRRLGTTTDGTVPRVSPKVGSDSWEEHNNGERDVTVVSDLRVRLDGPGRTSDNVLGSTLENVVKFGFTANPVNTSEPFPHGHDPSGRTPTAGNNFSRDQYSLAQIGHLGIRELCLADGSIPPAAFNTRINIAPPSEIIISRGVLKNAFDNDFLTFDDGVTTYDEDGIPRDTEGRYATSFDEVVPNFDSETVTFDVASGPEQDYEVKTFDESDDTFDVSTNSFDASNTIGRLSLFSTRAQTFDNSTETYDTQ